MKLTEGERGYKKGSFGMEHTAKISLMSLRISSHFFSFRVTSMGVALHLLCRRMMMPLLDTWVWL